MTEKINAAWWACGYDRYLSENRSANERTQARTATWGGRITPPAATGNTGGKEG